MEIPAGGARGHAAVAVRCARRLPQVRRGVIAAEDRVPGQPAQPDGIAALLPLGLLLLASVASVALFARETANRSIEELSEPA